MRDSETFAQRAAACLAEHESATLDNVRERCLRAATAWTDMARRAERTEKARDLREARPLASNDS